MTDNTETKPARKKTKRRKQRESWGRIRQLRSGRHQASYVGPDLQTYKATSTFESLDDARAWVRDERKLIDAGTWVPPHQRNSHDERPTFAEYAAAWMADRSLKPSTVDWYNSYLNLHIIPVLGDLRLDEITPMTVRRWHANLDTGPTGRAHAYAAFRSIINTAVADDLITVSPCKITGAGSARRKRKITPATLPELDALIKALPDRYAAIVLIGAWLGLRYGEVAELRRSDLDLEAGVLHVRRGVTRAKHDDGHYGDVVGDPKTAAGVRDINIPPHILPALKDHLDRHAAHWFKCGGCTPEVNRRYARDGLLFPGTDGSHLRHSLFYKRWVAAREKIGRPDLRYHDLRHTGATMTAIAGATTAELMARLGHSSPAAAMIYQHAAASRDAEIAKLLSKMAGA